MLIVPILFFAFYSYESPGNPSHSLKGWGAGGGPPLWGKPERARGVPPGGPLWGAAGGLWADLSGP